MKRNLKYISIIIVAVIVSILAFDAIATMIFGSLGKTSESSQWNYILILYILLAIIGGSITFYKFTKIKSIATIFSAILIFGLFGFYYGGIMTDNNSQIALLTALVSAGLGILLGIRNPRFSMIIITPIATIAAYGFAFYAGTNAIALFTAFRFLGAILWGITCLSYIILTISNLFFILTNIKK